MAVPMVRPPRTQLDEVDLERLGEEGLVPRAEDPPGTREAFVGIAGVADGRVVGDGAGPADARRGTLAPAEIGEAVSL